MKNIVLIGAGNIGSRHLQSLKTVSLPLQIIVVDPSSESLKTAKERCDSVEGAVPHEINFMNTLPSSLPDIDVAIIATSSAVRKQALEELLARTHVRYLLLEKILFNRPDDYDAAQKKFNALNIKAWVNCPMRVMPAYRDCKNMLQSGRLSYLVSGANWGLACNAIHFVDHLSYLNDCREFAVSTDLLDNKLIPSKRLGFFELNGTLTVKFQDGSLGVFSHFSEGDAPIMITISNQKARVIMCENERKMWIATPQQDWKWEEHDADIPYQSQLTAPVIEDILHNGDCHLTPYAESMRLHLQLYEPIRNFLHLDHYPFT